METLYGAWERFKDLLRRCSHRGLPLWLQVQTFYNSLNLSTRQLIDAITDVTVSDVVLIKVVDIAAGIFPLFLAVISGFWDRFLNSGKAGHLICVLLVLLFLFLVRIVFVCAECLAASDSGLLGVCVFFRLRFSFSVAPMEERSESDMPPSTDELNELLKRLKFSEEESVQVINKNEDNSTQGFENWAISKIMASDSPNMKAMYRKGKDINSYEFWWSPFWLRVYNFPIELMARQTAVDVGNVLGELIAIDWKNRFGGWIEFMRLKVKIDVSKPLRKVVKLVDKDGVETIGVINGINSKNDDKEESQTNSRDENGQNEYKGKERSCEEESLSISPMYRRNQKNIGDGMGRFKSKKKRHKGQNGENIEESPARIVKRREFLRMFHLVRRVGNPVTVRDLKQLLVANSPDVAFPCETKIHSNSFSRIRSICRMEGCLPVSSEGKKGCLALLWREGVKVEV
ncbi:hypothetical protein Godav_023148 [Gossypium davidsonii]|uniref:DUF4283 domain-containing protein n=1 Tax=Gossypium davidsonii TaxID=34287 RepID=A0A7J8SR80_GOSDV|nr:hypothetical protein [Gossypium davidsonii]